MASGTGMSFKEAWEELDFSFIWETVTYMFSNIGETWDVMVVAPLSRMGEALVQGFTDAWDAVKDFLGMSSPSTLFMSAGTAMIDGLLAPFTNLGDKLRALVDGAMNMLPDFMKNMIMNPGSVMDTITGIDVDGAMDTAGTLADNAISATADAAGAAYNAL